MALSSGYLSGFIAKKLGSLNTVFSDEDHWDEVPKDIKEKAE